MQSRSVRTAALCLSWYRSFTISNSICIQGPTQKHFLFTRAVGPEATMSLFGKHKNRQTGPPAPPRRRDDNTRSDVQEEIEEDEYGGMYEAPPCERGVKVPQRQIEENVYLERTFNPAVPQRQAPPPRPSFSKLTPADDFFFDSQNRKPPDVNRTDKPGRKKMPAPPIAPQEEEDVYLDPTKEHDSSEELYLEPVEACTPPPRGSKMMPSSLKPALPSPEPLLKPPVPPDKSSSFTLPECKTGPQAEARRFSLPAKSPPPVPSKPQLLTNLKERSPSLQDLPVLENKPVASSGGGRAKKSSFESREWFAGDCNRKIAEDLLQNIKKDGAFLIRNSSTQSSRQPYTLAVLYQQKVYNVPVRFLQETQRYALGKEGKKNEETFVTLDDMISHHKNNQLLLIDSKSQAKHTTYLTYAAHP